EITALHRSPTPIFRNGAGHLRHGARLGAMSALHLLQRSPSAREEERCLLTGAMPGDKLLQLGPAVHHDGTRLQRHAASSARGVAPRRARTGVSRSGVSVSVPMG